MARVRGVDYLVWPRDLGLAEAEISSVAFGSRSFPAPSAGNVRVTASNRIVFALFQSTGGRLTTRERRGGVWSLRYLTAGRVRQQAIAATAFGSELTALGASYGSDRLYAVTVR